MSRLPAVPVTSLEDATLNFERLQSITVTATVGSTGLPFVSAPPPSGGDDLANLQALLTQGVRLLLQPNSTYRFSGPLIMPLYSQVEGCGPHTVCQAQGNNYVFQPGAQTRISNLQIAGPSSAQTSGGAINANGAINVTVNDVWLGSNLFTGFNLTGGGGLWTIDRVRWNGVQGCGTAFNIGDGVSLTSDVVITRVWGTAATNADMGRWFSVNGFTDTIHFDNCLFIKATNGSRWQNGGTNHKAKNLTIDGGQPGLRITGTLDLELISPTISNPTDGGIQVFSTTTGTRIRGGLIQRGNNDGVDIFGGSDTDVIGVTIQDCNQSNGTFGAGVGVSAAVSEFTVQGCRIGNFTAQAGNLKYGVLVAAGASNNYMIVNNRLHGCQTAGVQDNGTGASKIVANNL